MIALEKVLEVRRLLDDGALSRRAIARQTGVSRGTVNAIANGERGLFGAPPPDERDARRRPGQSGVARRCVGCGAMVYLPCLVCRTRRHIATEPSAGRPAKRLSA